MSEEAGYVRDTEMDAMTDKAAEQHAAKKLIERYGHDAARQARIRAEELRLIGDAEGETLWTSVHDTVTRLLGGG